MSNNKYQAAFKAAQREAKIEIDEMDLMIIDQAQNVCEAINKIEGFSASIESITEYSKTMSFTYLVSFNNLRSRVTMSAERGKMFSTKPEFSIDQGAFVLNAQKVKLDKPEDIENVLMVIVRSLGASAAKDERATKLQDSLSRRRLMLSMPELNLG